jgi:pimeloyl-ACP methyl ester carboxylesterase
MLAVALLAAPAGAHAAPMVLLLHGGGWQSGDLATMYPYRDDFEAHGYRTRVVAYPLGSVTRSIDYVDAVAQAERLRGEPVIAYGISAGGTIAAALAAAGRVDGGVDVIGPTDFTRWYSPVGIEMMLVLGMTGAEKRSASPYWRLDGRQAPQLLQCGLADPITTYDQCTTYTTRARIRNPDTTLQTMVNAHGQWVGDRDRARAWVQARWPASGRAAWRLPAAQVTGGRAAASISGAVRGGTWRVSTM